MRISRQFQDRLFSYEKVLNAQKHSQANINQQNKNKRTKSNKGNGFLCTQTSKKVKVACFVFWCFLCIRNLFIKKKKICLEIVLIPSFYYTTDMYPYQPTYWASIYTLIFTQNHLWESLLFMKIFLNPFCLWESFLFIEKLFIKILFESFLSVRIFSFYENLFSFMRISSFVRISFFSMRTLFFFFFF